MSIRPIDLNGMIQNTNEVQNIKTQEDAKGELQQNNLLVQAEVKETEKDTTVQGNEETYKKFFDPNDGGDGSGYTGNHGKKKEHKEEAKRKDGVFLKDGHVSFDMKV